MPSDEFMARNCCLMLIDLQNEFLSPDNGRFLIHESSRPFLNNLPSLTATFRRFGNPIYWVRAQYNQRPLPDGVQQWDAKSVQVGTHRGKVPCCEKGGIGAEFTEDIASLISGGSDSENVVITKTWYSAFKDTGLFVGLKDRGIKHIFLAGLLTNICVMATALDAIDLGFNVIVLQDCVGYRRIASHERALKIMSRYGVRVALSSDLDTSEKISIPASDLPRLYYVSGSIPSWRVLVTLYEKEIRFNPIRLPTMSHLKEPRLPEPFLPNHHGKSPVVPVFVEAFWTNSSGHTNLESQPETVVNGSIAILHYLETYYNSLKPLLPSVSQRTSRALSLSRIQESENPRRLFHALEDAHSEAEESGTTLDDVERNYLIKSIDDELDIWEVYAEKTVFIAGNDFGLADCAFFPVLACMVYRGFAWRRSRVDSLSSLGSDWPHLQAYFRRVWERDGENGCAQIAQPIGWEREGKVNIWKGTKSNPKGND